MQYHLLHNTLGFVLLFIQQISTFILPSYQSILPPFHPSILSSILPSIQSSILPTVHLSVHPFIEAPTHPSIFPSISSNALFLCLSTHSSIHASTHPSCFPPTAFLPSLLPDSVFIPLLNHPERYLHIYFSAVSAGWGLSFTVCVYSDLNFNLFDSACNNS